MTPSDEIAYKMKTSRGNHVVHLGNSAAAKRSHPTRNGRGKRIKGGKKRKNKIKNQKFRRFISFYP
jgi:hypothetical protein